jgi:hypothetical protein
MAKKILVPLGLNDRAEEMITFIENVTRPGMEVVFLVRYPVGGIKWPTKEPDTETASEVKELIDYYSWEENLRRAKSKVSSASEALRAKGIEAAVDVYAGSLKKAVRSHTLNGDVHLIMTRAGIGEWIGRLLDATMSVFRSFKRPSFSPVMLINPRTLH